MNKEFLQQLLATDSVAGDESDAADLFCKYLQSECTIERDIIGNVYAVLNPASERRLMIEAHIDEIGFQVTYIDDSGFVYVRQNGGIDCACLPGSQVVVKTRSGERLAGVIGKRPIHIQTQDERGKVSELEDLWIDTGLTADEVKQKISVGDTVSYCSNFLQLSENRISSKGIDNKIGVYIVAETMKALSEKQLNTGVFGVASVQEEVGCKGAKVSGYKVNPQTAICIDVGFATDTPDISKKKYGDIALGRGITVTSHTDSNRQLSLFAENIAQANNIPFQLAAHHIASGGTDTVAVQLSHSGVKTLLLAVPCRYMHTQVEMCDLRDVQAAIDLLVQMVCAIDKEIND
ncbi:MAG: hypothetical protein LBD59_00685 [Prevotellaceae bacterium]|jgi:endoglucanase|nr:hypothetical protein [Prevotellaceae bacterium]